MLINVFVEVQIILLLLFLGKKLSSLFVDFEFAWHRMMVPLELLRVFVVSFELGGSDGSAAYSGSVE